MSLEGSRFTLVYLSYTIQKVKFFYYLALHGRVVDSRVQDAPCSYYPEGEVFLVACSTRPGVGSRERRMRHGLQDSAACALCNQEDETTDHLFVSCVYNHEVWHRVLLPAN